MPKTITFTDSQIEFILEAVDFHQAFCQARGSETVWIEVQQKSNEIMELLRDE